MLRASVLQSLCGGGFIGRGGALGEELLGACGAVRLRGLARLLGVQERGRYEQNCTNSPQCVERAETDGNGRGTK
jgi:hypothetical protein